jgi:hypothetical protein
MNKIIFVLMLTLSALPAFAQRRHPNPIPHPRNPYPQNCTVVAVDRYNRVMAHFWGYTDPRNGMCRDGLRNCNFEIRRRGWYDARCLQVRK